MISSQSKSDNIARLFYKYLGYIMNANHLAFFFTTVYTNIQVQLTYLLVAVQWNLLLEITVELSCTMLLICLALSYLRSVYYLSVSLPTHQPQEDYKIYCKECEKYKSTLTKHCFYCHTCVPTYRQHCFLFSNCISNYTYKYLLSLSLSALCWYSLSFLLDILHFRHQLNQQFHSDHVKVYFWLLMSLFLTAAAVLGSMSYLLYNYYLILNNMTAVDHLYGKYEGKCKYYSPGQLVQCLFSSKQRAQVSIQFSLNYQELVGPLKLKDAFIPL